MQNNIYILIFCLINTIYTYIEVQLVINRTKQSVLYQVPIRINDIPYSLSISLQNKQDFIVPISSKVEKKKKKRNPHTNSKQLIGVISAFSIQGYSLQGWKRIFLQALLFIQSHYHHLLDINLTNFRQVSPLNEAQPVDGLINFGPDLQKNQFYKIIKANSHLEEDVISIYRKGSDQSTKIQFGGVQYQYAKGHHDGYKFYALTLTASQGRWRIPIQMIQCSRKSQSGWNNYDIFNIVNSGGSYAISISSPLIKLPLRLASDIERNFDNAHTACRITENHRLSCTNISNMELMISKIQFYINDGGYINITLWDLVESQNQKGLQTVFNIQFVQDESDLQIGQALFRSYYVSIDLAKKRMIYSPINHFPGTNAFVYLLRFILLFAVLVIFTTVFLFFWQLCDPTSKVKLDFRQNQSPYHRALQSEEIQ